MPENNANQSRGERVRAYLSSRSVALLVISALVTVLSFGGRLVWWLDLVSHFRVQLAWGSLVVGLILLGLGQVRAALGAAALAAFNAAFVVPVYFGEPSSEERTHRIVYVNVLSTNPTRDAVVAFVLRETPDAVVLSEVRPNWAQDLAALDATYPHRIWHPRHDNFGIALLSRLPFEGGVQHFGGADAPPSIEVQFADGLTLLATHTTPPMTGAWADVRNAQLSAIATRAAAIDGPVLMVGDLNLTPWSPWFGDLVSDGGFTDSRDGFGVHTTWPTWLPSPLGIPIDHALGSRVRFIDRRVGEALGSDHHPIAVDLSIAP